MIFSHSKQPKKHCGGRKPSPATIEKRQKQAEAERSRQLKAFAEFENAENGYFNGFEFVDIFHEKIHKSDAIFTAEADDSADVLTPWGEVYHTGSDGITAYFYSKTPSKMVVFNRSIYYF